MKSFIHDFGSSIFSSHCHTCILACCVPARPARKVGRHVTAPSDTEAIPNVSAGECLSLRSGRSRRTPINPAANVASVTLSSSYTTLTEQYTVMDHAIIHVQALISHQLQCDRCTSNPHNLHAWEELLNFGRPEVARGTTWRQSSRSGPLSHAQLTTR